MGDSKVRAVIDCMCDLRCEPKSLSCSCECHELERAADAILNAVSLPHPHLPIEDCDCEPTDWRCPHGD